MVSLVVGKLSLQNQRALMKDFKARTQGKLPELFTSDYRKCYRRILLETYGKATPRERQGTRGRFPNPILTPPSDLVYAVVHKHRRKGRVVKTEIHQIFGTPVQLEAALLQSPVSRKVNTAFVERSNGTARHRNSRQVRKTYAFSKKWERHEDQAWLSLVGYNFCWAVRTLREEVANGQWRQRTPAMVAGLTDHVWPVAEWLAHPSVQRL